MTITIVNVTESTGSGTESTTDVPAGIQVDDMLIWCQANQNAGAIPNNADFIEIESREGTALGGMVQYRWATSSEPASYTTTLMPTGKSAGVMIALRGVDKTNPFDVATPTPITNFNAGAEAIGLPAITTVTDLAWVCAVAMCVISSGGTIDFTGTNMDAIDEWIWTAAGGANAGVAFMHEEKTPAGAFSPTVTLASDPNRHIGVTFALRPAAGGGGPTYTATLDATLPKVTGSINATSTDPTYAASLDATLPKVTGSINATSTDPTYVASLDATLPKVTGSITADGEGPVFTGSLAGTFPKVTGSITADGEGPVYAGSLDALLPTLTADIVATSTVPAYLATLDAEFPALIGEITAEATLPAGAATLNAVLPAMTGSITADGEGPVYTALLDATFPALIGSIVADGEGVAYFAALDATLPRLSGSISGTYEPPAAAISATLDATFPRLTALLTGSWVPNPDDWVNITILAIAEHVRSVSIAEHARSVEIAESSRDVGIMEHTRVVVIEEG